MQKRKARYRKYASLLETLLIKNELFDTLSKLCALVERQLRENGVSKVCALVVYYIQKVLMSFARPMSNNINEPAKKMTNVRLSFHRFNENTIICERVNDDCSAAE